MIDENLYIGFKGNHNASCILVGYLSDAPYLLTNSFSGLRKDIEQLQGNFNCVMMFGIDKNLKDTVRIEVVAEREGSRLLSQLDLDELTKRLTAAGVANYVSHKPTHYLCNEAYWYALEKFGGRVIFIHIPSIKNMNETFLDKIKSALG